MRFMSIASGSSGNSYYIGTDKASVLLDTGISLKRIERGLEKAGLSGRDLDAVFITHEHIDHIKGLGVLARKYAVPIYATYGTIDGIMTTKSLGVFDYNILKPIHGGDTVRINDLSVSCTSVSHDANDPVCYSFASEKKKVSVATDLGRYDEKIIDFITESDALLIEANHDIRMLEVGPYPFMLKQRILGDRGHLSNEAGGELIRAVLNDHIKYIGLGHLSEHNNYPELAYATVKQILADNVYTGDVRDFGLTVASRSECGDIIDI